MVRRAVDGLFDSGVVDAVVVTAPRGHVEQVRSAIVRPDVTVVDGGPDRVASVAAGLAAVATDAHVVLVHDAARCLCPSGVVRGVVEAVRAGHEAVVPVVAVADTLKRLDHAGRVTATVDRSGLAAVQTPQGFRADVLRAAHARAGRDRAAGRGVPATDDAGLVESDGGTVVTVPGDPRAVKITTAPDLALAELLAVVPG